MRVDLPEALPPRARNALIAFGVRSLAEAANLSDDELLRIKGVGRAAVEVLHAAFRDAGAEQQAAEGKSDELGVGPGEGEPSMSFNREILLGHLARGFVDLLAERHALAPHIIALAWDLAIAFDQERRRSAGVDLELHDGLKVRFAGKVCEVRLSPPPPGTEHRTVALVPVADA